MEKLEPLCTVGGNVKLTAIVEKLSKKIQHRMTRWSSKSTSGYLPKSIKRPTLKTEEHYSQRLRLLRKSPGR